MSRVEAGSQKPAPRPEPFRSSARTASEARWSSKTIVERSYSRWIQLPASAACAAVGIMWLMAARCFLIDLAIQYESLCAHPFRVLCGMGGKTTTLFNCPIKNPAFIVWMRARAGAVVARRETMPRQLFPLQNSGCRIKSDHGFDLTHSGPALRPPSRQPAKNAPSTSAHRRYSHLRTGRAQLRRIRPEAALTLLDSLGLMGVKYIVPVSAAIVIPAHHRLLQLPADH